MFARNYLFVLTNGTYRRRKFQLEVGGEYQDMVGMIGLDEFMKETWRLDRDEESLQSRMARCQNISKWTESGGGNDLGGC